jgi:hypothetical protein
MADGKSSDRANRAGDDWHMPAGRDAVARPRAFGGRMRQVLLCLIVSRHLDALQASHKTAGSSPRLSRAATFFFCEKEGNSLNFASEYNSIYTNHLERARPSKQAPTGPICKISTLPEDTPVFTTLSRTRWSSRKIQQPDTSIESLLKCWTPIGSSLFESGKNKIRWHSDGRNKSPTKAKEAYLHLPLPRHLDNEHSKGEEDQKLQMAGPQRRGSPSYNPKTKELSYISKASPRSDESPPSPAPGRPQEVEMRRDRQQ